MFDFSIQWFSLLIDVAIKTFILWSLAWVTLRVLRVRDSNLRHRIWSGVMLGMLCLPFLALVLPAIPLPIQLETTWFEQGGPAEENLSLDSTNLDAIPDLNESAGVQSDESLSASQVLSESSNRTLNREPNHFEGLAFNEFSVPPSVSNDTMQLSPQADSEVALAIQAESLPSATTPTETATTSTTSWHDWFTRAPSFMLFGWLAISLVFMFRLIIGLLSTSWLLKRSPAIDRDAIFKKCPELANWLVDENATVRNCRLVRVPVTVGWLRPAVLLPEQWKSWSQDKLKAVLIHELTHVARKDFAVALLAELNRCLYWFHPVAWWLQRQLADLAEEACDDAAIGYTGDPTGYATHLLDVAANLTLGGGRIVHPGMPMARESNVETRINTILDFTRPLSRRLSWKTAVLIVSICVPVIGFAAAIRPATSNDEQTEVTESTPAADSEENQSEENSNAEAAADEKQARTDFRIFGQVIDNDKQGIPNATVQLYRMHGRRWYASERIATLVREFELDEEGRFDESIPLDGFPDDPQGLVFDTHGRDLLVVHAPGHVYATRTFENREEDPEEQVIRLWEETSVRGRILNLEGQPVANAEVSIYELMRSHRDKLEDWLKTVSFKPSPKKPSRMAMMARSPKAEERFPVKRDIQLPSNVTSKIVTDENGEFELHGVGPDDLVLVNVEGPGIAKNTLHVLARETNTFYATHASNISRSGAYYGKDFDYIAQPSVPVFGVVRDIETKEPLVGVEVAVGSVYGTQMSHSGYSTVKTDSQGRYRIEGLPVPPPKTRGGDRNRLAVRTKPLPYIENDWFAVPLGDGLNPVEFNIELRRAVIARGRLTNKETGEPIQAKVYYTPFNTNPNVSKYKRFADGVMTMLGNDSRYFTDEDGYFEVPVIPGRGVICAKSEEGAFRTAYGASEIPEFENVQGLGAPTSDHVVPTLHNSIVEVNPDENVDKIEVEMNVDPGLSLTVKFVDPDGNPLNGVSGSGLTSNRRWSQVDESKATATGLAIGEVRPMILSHEERKLKRLARLIPEEGQTEFVVTLYPTTVVSGRLIDPDEQPLPDVHIESRHDVQPNSINISANETTDAEGRFKFFLPVGATYSLIGFKDEYLTVAKDLKLEKPQRIDLGDLVVDPDAERWAEVKPKREPIYKTRKEEKPVTTAKPTQKPTQVAYSEPQNSKTLASDETNTTLKFSGSVVSPSGEPVTGAKIHLIYGWRTPKSIDRSPLAVTDPDGKFQFSITPNSNRTGEGWLVAVADGYSFAHGVSAAFEKTGRLLKAISAQEQKWVREAISKTTDEIQLQPKNKAIRGRLVDTEGQPVVGATLHVREISKGIDGDLKAWEEAGAKKDADYYSARQKLKSLFGGIRAKLALKPVQTDQQGWFEIDDLGPNRIAEIIATHPEMATNSFYVRSHSGEVIRLLESAREPSLGAKIYYPNKFTHLMAPAQVVVGRVTVRGTDGPLSGCLIRANRISSSPLGGSFLANSIHTFTDDEGNYRLHGLPLGRCELEVIPSSDSPLVPIQFVVNSKVPGEVVTQNLQIPQGVFVEGQILDKQTGKPIVATLQYSAFQINPEFQSSPRIRLADLHYHYRSDRDGRFRIPVLPGPGLIGLMADDHQKYRRGVGANDIEFPRDEKNGFFLTAPYFMTAGSFHYLFDVNADADSKKVIRNIELTPGTNLQGSVVRSDGTKVSNYLLFGHQVPSSWREVQNETFDLTGYYSDRPQRLIAYLPEENIVGSLLLDGDPPGSLQIKLKPAGAVHGQLVDSDGEPLRGVQLHNGQQVNDNWGNGSANPREFGNFSVGRSLRQYLKTDDHGRFTIEGLVPGLKYSARVTAYRKIGGRMQPFGIGDAFEGVEVAAGENRDLGKLVIEE